MDLNLPAFTAQTNKEKTNNKKIKVCEREREREREREKMEKQIHKTSVLW